MRIDTRIGNFPKFACVLLRIGNWVRIGCVFGLRIVRIGRMYRKSENAYRYANQMRINTPKSQDAYWNN